MPTATAKGRSATSKAKQQSKKAAAAKNGNGPSKRELAQQRDLELAPQVLAMRQDGKSWGEIKTKLGVDQPKGQVLVKMAAVRPKDRIKAADDAELGKKVVEARDKQELSWADIAVRAGVTMGKVKSLYTATSGKDAGESRVTKAAAPKAKAAPKAAPKAKAAPAKGRAAATKTKTRKRGAADPSKQG